MNKKTADGEWHPLTLGLRRSRDSPGPRNAPYTGAAGQLQQKEDEQPAGSDPLDIASMPREQRDKLKRRLLAVSAPG